jgi:hypothetical protein
MLKQFKIITFAPTCFGSRRNHHQGTVLCLAKTTECGFSVVVGIDVVNVMAAYQPVAQACGELLPDDGSCMNRNMSEQVL